MPVTIRQVENALALLEFFAARKRPATLADVTAHFGWPRSSTWNLLTTLAEGGWLYEPRARGGWYPTPRWQTLAGEIAEGEPAPERLAALVARLAEETGETVWASAPVGLHAVFLAAAESPAGIRYAARQGQRVPIHLTASGQALLSQMPERDREAILRKAPFDRRGPAAARDAAEVRAQIAEGLARGWFRSASYWSADLGGVSIPVSVEGRMFSLTVAGPLFRVADKEEAHARLLHRAVAESFGPDHAARTLSGLRLLA
ncbi:IclR family transcriptional regulator [Albimonas sp. CAU 1670]|uniref:IclR family transcriptional regulator n=1 Tax=Albimonas sp. CAU 1670 TaxID=3032599 RepID=UPI0023DC40EA|nr:IclR family transcriptional regulator [Albimonas sp. CAU 1670]MDF2232432.1 IclR family transcriptional regulator [Albimonas sp. CAU 1670]